MDGATRSRPRVLVLAAVAIVAGLAVYGSVALLGDDDPSPPRSGPAPTSALPTSTVVATGPRNPVAGSPTTTAAATEPAVPSDAAPDSGGGTDSASGPGYDSDACVMFRQLLEMVDDPQLRGAAAQVGCL
ncbi:MAG: hypothetical protein QOG43_3331 [Actinomycetota bacterium]|nr:hypothetical protein [Actinomycetota bacterium]